MEPIISVIILDFADDTYLIRCLNSIKRQTCGEPEFFLMNSECSENIKNTYKIKTISGSTRQESLNNALKLSQGKYVFFTSTTAVISPNVFEALMDGEKKIRNATSAIFRIPRGNDFVECYSSPLCLYGKLFEKESLEKNNINFEDSLFLEERFVAKYLQLFSNLSSIKTAEIYETNTELLEQISSFGVDINQFEDLIRILVDTPVGSSKYFWYKFIDKFIDELYVKINGNLKILIPYIVKIAEYLNEKKELNYQLSGKYVKVYYENLLENEDSEAYEILKTYLKEFEKDSEYLNVMLASLNISLKQYEIMKDYDFEDYLFYREKMFDKTNVISQNVELDEIKKALEIGQQKIENLEQIIQKELNRIFTERFKTNENNITSELRGTELAEFVIESYGKGNLGFKTILKSMKAWLKYKV